MPIIREPDTVPEFTTDRTKVYVPWPETIVAPAPMPVPVMDQPLQLTGAAGAGDAASVTIKVLITPEADVTEADVNEAAGTKTKVLTVLESIGIICPSPVPENILKLYPVQEFTGQFLVVS